MSELKAGWQIGCPQCTASKFPCDQHAPSIPPAVDVAEGRRLRKSMLERQEKAEFALAQPADGGEVMGKTTHVKEIRADFMEFGQMVATLWFLGSLLTDDEMAVFRQDPIIDAIGRLSTPIMTPGKAVKIAPTDDLRAKMTELVGIVRDRLKLERVQ